MQKNYILSFYMQLSKHRSAVPRMVCEQNGTVYSSAYCTSPSILAEQHEDTLCVRVTTGMYSAKGERMKADTERKLSYTLTPTGLRICAENVLDLKFILPLITGELTACRGSLTAKEETFFLTGGFVTTKYTLTPDINGVLEFCVI